jgi:hypothetical protein
LAAVVSDGRLVKWLLIGVLAVVICDVLFGLLVRATLTAAVAGQFPPMLGIILQVLALPVIVVLVLFRMGERSPRVVFLGAILPVAGYLAGSVHLAALAFGFSVVVFGYRHERSAPLGASGVREPPGP